MLSVQRTTRARSAAVVPFVIPGERYPLNVAQQLIGNRARRFGDLINGNVVAPKLDGAADACVRQVGEVDGEHVH